MRKLFIVIGVILALLVATSIRSSAEENVINGCYHKVSGQLRIVNDLSECVPSELPISWNQTSQSVSDAVKVYDANNQYLGILIDHSIGNLNNFTVIVFNPYMKKSIAISKVDGYVYPITRDIIPPLAINGCWNNDYAWWFESNNCFGDPVYITGMPSDIIFRGDVNADIPRYIMKTVPLRAITYRSILRPDGSCTPIEVQTFDYCFSLIEIPKEEILLTLPVATPLRYE